MGQELLVLRRLSAVIVVAVAVVAGAALWSARAAESAAPQAPLLPARGEASAAIVIMLFSDFQCPSCAEVEPALKTVREEFPKDVQVIFKHSPLPIHPQAPLAHEAAVEAARQGRFWEMHDLPVRQSEERSAVRI